MSLEGMEAVSVKQESDSDGCGDNEAALSALYEDYVVKQEHVLGPELLQKPSVVYTPPEAACMKPEQGWDSDGDSDGHSETEDHKLNEELVDEDLELGPVVLKEELELGPVVLQLPDTLYSLQASLKTEDKDTHAQTLLTERCSVVLERVLVDLEARMYTIGPQTYSFRLCDQKQARREIKTRKNKTSQIRLPAAKKTKSAKTRKPKAPVKKKDKPSEKIAKHHSAANKRKAPVGEKKEGPKKKRAKTNSAEINPGAQAAPQDLSSSTDVQEATPEKPAGSSSSSEVNTLTAETNFKCEKCFKRFSIKSDLERHLNTHELMEATTSYGTRKQYSVHVDKLSPVKLIIRGHKRGNKKGFYVVQFIQLPFESVDDYVCVPYSWVILRRPSDRKVLVAYPKDEHPFDTRDRAKRREKYGDDWKYYWAIIKYESNTYENAEFWIETKNDNDGPWKGSQLNTRDTQPEPDLDRRLRSSTHAWSGPKKNKPLLAVKPYDNPRKPMLKISLKRPIQPIPTGDLANKRPIPTGDLDNKRLKPSTSKTPPNTLEPSQPVSVNERPALPVQQENLPQLLRPQETSTAKSNEIEANSQQTQLHRILTAPTTVSTTPSAINQTSQLHRHTQSQFQPVSENSYSNPQPRETDIGRSAEGTHNNQRSQCLMTTPSTSHHVPNLIRVSSQLFERTSRNSSPSVIKNVAKKTRLENTTGYISAAQHLSNPSVRSSCSLCTQSPHNHLQISREPVNHSRCHIGGNGIDQRLLQGTINNTPAAQNLSNLPYQSRFFVEKSHQRQHLPTQEDYLQEIARIQGLLRRPDILPTTDQRGYIQHSMMNVGFVRQNQADHTQQVLRPQLLGGSTKGTYTVHNVNSQNVGMNIPFTSQNSSYVLNQSHHNVELIKQRQNLPNYQDPQRDLPTSKVQFDPSFNSRSNSQRPEPQITSPSVLLNISNPKRQSNVHGNYLLQDPRIQVRLNQSSTEHHSNLTTVPQNITVEPFTVQDIEVQTTSSGPSHETQFILNPDIHVCQDPRTKKLMVNQSTTTDFNMDHDHCNETVGSPVIEMSLRVVDSECQTDINLLEKRLSPCQEVASDHEAITDHEIVSDQEEISDQAEVSDNEMSTDVPALDMNNTVICTEESPPQNNTEERPTIVQNSTTENQQVHPRVDAEQKMLNLFDTVFTQMGAHMSYTCEMFKKIRTSVFESAKTYQLLLETVESLNSTRNFQVAVSPSNVVTAEVPQLTEERPAGESERANSVNEEENTNNGSGEIPEKTRRRHTFVLPSGFDPNDSKWTLKYKKKAPGLVELMPNSGIYVRSSELKRCKRKSKDCKMLARLLLTEVFNKSALSVCSLTGGRAKAFTNVDIDVRPGLDADARMVLLAYVEEHGLKRKWFTSDSQSIASSMRSKIQEIRAKSGRSVSF